jgi:hypothetical protein
MANQYNRDWDALTKEAYRLFSTTDLSMAKIAKIIKVNRITLMRWKELHKWERKEVDFSFYGHNQSFPIGDRIGVTDFKENVDKGTAEISAILSTEPRTSEEIIKLLKIDTTKWKLSTYWNKEKSNGTWFISALVTSVTVKEDFSTKFIEFLEKYKQRAIKVIKKKHVGKYPAACFIFNKQDAHLNKYDINGNNDIQKRFDGILDKINRILARATIVNNVKKAIYILGSDLIDSEWTEMTTKGTPQKNILPYYKSFELICNHEIDIINLLLEHVDNLEILFVPGNHDQYVGWHVVNWLQVYYRNQKNLKIDTGTSNTKYVQFSNSAIMFNHGDGIKPEKLAQIFPIDFKEAWSSCNNYYIFTGDKHHELARDIGGIRFYQIPALSKAISAWDSKHGWTMSKAEMTAFLITENVGLTDMYKEKM